MSRRLRLRFIVATMLALLLVLSVVLGLINASGYRQTVSDIDSVLGLLRDNDGALPAAPAELDWRAAGGLYQSPELPYEIRYFSALLDDSGEVVSTHTDSISAVDEHRVAEYAREAWDSGRASGFCGDYRFLRYDEEAGTRVVFLDCGRVMSMQRGMLLRSAAVTLCVLAAVFVLLLPLSGRIVKPFVEAQARQERFVTDAGHELRTPLTVIDADAALIEMESGPCRWLDDIRAQTRRLAALTDDLVDLARMQERGAPAMEAFCISDAVREAAEPFLAPARTRACALDVRVQPGLQLRGDEAGIRRLVGVLLDNAVKYAEPDSPILCALERRGRGVRLRVQNETRALTAQDTRDMFDRFYRADASRASGTGGYGLGLSIARAIAQAHRGRIDASLDARHRLSVTVVLPD